MFKGPQGMSLAGNAAAAAVATVSAAAAAATTSLEMIKCDAITANNRYSSSSSSRSSSSRSSRSSIAGERHSLRGLKHRPRHLAWPEGPASPKNIEKNVLTPKNN